ncbi:hypothetical protein RDI58_017867 [Solanum bulbocastanum]|uniref:MADS-box domain-containing protein n=1 Tax=Solanum bulbocastanum TaxID=147425 RepID=A0AAN8TFU3_SOLBU
MGTGKKKIEIEKIEDKTSRMYTFSKREKGLFKKNEELESLTGYPMAYVVFSSTKTPYTYGDVNSTIKRHFPSTICTKRSASGMNSHDSSCDVDAVISGGSLGLKSSSTLQKNSLHGGVEGIDVEEC